jgi:hypothetical protein
MANLHPFATVNQNSTDLHSPNESSSLGRGISGHSSLGEFMSAFGGKADIVSMGL